MIEHEKADGIATYAIGFCGVCFQYVQMGTEILNFVTAALGTVLILIRAYYDVPRIIHRILERKIKKKNVAKRNSKLKSG